MKKFLFKISLYILPIFTLLLVLGSFADGNTDDNYRHFTSQASNLVFGDSRGSQAVVPSVLNDKLKADGFDNFSINIKDSPYGNVYLSAIKKKIDPNTKNGIFILTVDPWNLSLSNKEGNIDVADKMSVFSDMHFYSLDPNYEYLLKHYDRSWFKIFLEREQTQKSATYLHKDGWLEVNVDMDEKSKIERVKEKVAFYKDFASSQRISTQRLNTFIDLIHFLKNKGEVYVVRIPASKEIMAIENKYSPNFNKIISDITNSNNIPYFDFSPSLDDYQYTDGNHMYKESSKVFTAQIADSIQKRKRLK